MSKVILYIAQSLDGYIARPDGNLDWLTSIPMPETGDYGYAELLENIETIIMGRKTYEELISFGMEWPYNGYKTYVVSGDPDLNIQSPDTFLSNGNLKSFIQDLNQRTNKDTWLVGGGQLIKSFINEGLLDQMIISIIPKMIGEGIPLFVDNIAECDWKLEDTRAFNTGVVNLIYSKQ